MCVCVCRESRHREELQRLQRESLGAGDMLSLLCSQIRLEEKLEREMWRNRFEI